MNKKAINITNKETKKEGFFVGMKKKVIPAFSGAIMACSLFSTQVMAATDTSSVTQPLMLDEFANVALDNRKCLVFIRGFDPIMDNKYIPFGHPAFDLTADGKGTPYVHVIEAESSVIGATFEILTKRSVEYYEALKKKGGNIYIDDLTYDEFMLLGDTELGKRFISMDEKVQKEKLQSSQNNELEYSEESVTRKVRSETKAAQQHQERKALDMVNDH